LAGTLEAARKANWRPRKPPQGPEAVRNVRRCPVA